MGVDTREENTGFVQEPSGEDTAGKLVANLASRYRAADELCKRHGHNEGLASELSAARVEAWESYVEATKLLRGEEVSAKMFEGYELLNGLI